MIWEKEVIEHVTLKFDISELSDEKDFNEQMDEYFTQEYKAVSIQIKDGLLQVVFQDIFTDASDPEADATNHKEY